MANCLNDEIALGTLSAVHAGKEVTAHEKPLNFYGKTSAGYIILDPTTGAGAYMISSGENGGSIDYSTVIDFIGSFLTDLPNALVSHYGKMISKIKQVFDFSTDAKECGMGFAAIKLAAVTAISVGLTFLFMPYMFLLGMVLSTIIVSMIRILIVEIALVGLYSSRFKC